MRPLLNDTFISMGIGIIGIGCKDMYRMYGGSHEDDVMKKRTV